jgi:immunoglobulin-binding protein 1
MDISASNHLPLPVYLSRTLQILLPVLSDEEPVSLPNSQTTLLKGLDELYLVARMVTSLGVFSDNEGVEELGDGEMVFMTVGWVLGEVESRTGLGGYGDRIACLRRSDVSNHH